MQDVAGGPMSLAGTFSALVRSHRVRRRLTQEELAERAGISSRSVREMERGAGRSPRANTVELLASALELHGEQRTEFVAAGRELSWKRRTVEPAAAAQLAAAAEPAAAADARHAQPVVTPRQLPCDIASFTGRAAHLSQLDALLARQGRPGTAEQPRIAVISAIAGTAGVGKTALAVHWAHHVRDEFPDGQLYVNLRGFDAAQPAMEPAEAIRGFLDAFEVPPQRIPATLDAQAALYRSLLSGRRVLVVLDNARDSDQVRPLLPGTAGCLVVLTSRNRLTGLVAAHGAHTLALDVLAVSEARELLAHRLGPRRVAAEPDAVEDIITHCARLPLALAIVAAHAATNPQLALADVAAQLRDTHGRLDLLTSDAAATDVRAVFSWSYRTLSAPAAHLFRLLGQHPGPDISVPAAASLTGRPPTRTRTLLTELTRTNLLTEHTPGRYTFHDLLRAYAAELAQDVDCEDERNAATGRMLDHYLHSAHAAALMLNPVRDPIALPLAAPRPGTTPELHADREQAMAWLTAEHPVLLAVINHTVSTGWDSHTWQLAWTLVNFLDRRGHWHDWIATQRAAVAAAQRVAEPIAQAIAHRHVGHASSRLGRFGDAHTHLQNALELHRQADDQIGQAHTHLTLGTVCEQQGRRAEALEHGRLALDLYRAAGDRVWQANSLNAVGWCYAQLGDHEQALVHCHEALTIQQELGDAHGQAHTWDSLGCAYQASGRHGEAITCYQQAIDRYQDLGDRYYEALSRTHIGDCHHAAGDIHASRRAWQLALTALVDLDHPDAEHVRTKLAGLGTAPSTR